MSEEKTSDQEKTTAQAKVKRPRRIFQCGDPQLTPSQIVTYSRLGYEKDGVRTGGVTRVRNRNEFFQFVIPAPVREGEEEIYDREIEAMKRISAVYSGVIQEVGPDAENTLPSEMQPETPEALKQRLKSAEAARSDLESESGTLKEAVNERDLRVQELERQLENQKKLLAKLSASK